MDVLFRLGNATAAQIRAGLADPPSYSAVRAHLRTLEEKGHIKHRAEDLRYVYFPVETRERAMRRAVRHLVKTFFDGSPSRAVTALLDAHAAELTSQDLERLEELIEQSRKENEP